jgi:hypothetical protein
MYMSRKDYIAIADAIKRTRKCYPDAKEAFELFVSAVAVVLKKDNPRFDYDRFWDYIER